MSTIISLSSFCIGHILLNMVNLLSETLLQNIIFSITSRWQLELPSMLGLKEHVYFCWTVLQPHLA